MRMLSNTRLFQAAVVAAGIVAISTTDALARSRGSWGSSGSSASYGSSSSASYGGYGASSGSYSSYGSYGSSGSSASYGSHGKHGGSSGGGMFARWHARKAAKHSSGSSASYGAYASSSGGSASYGSVSYGSSGSSGSYGGGSYGGATMYYSTPTDTQYEVPSDVPTSAPPEAPIETEAAIRVSVPADAVVFVNDRPTTSTGAERNFVSRGLTGGRTYAYKLRVEFTREGEQVVENKLVRLQAGQTIDLNFGAGEQVARQESAETDLTLHVPAAAKVTLAGAATKQAGELRSYSTDSLTAGQEWAGYVVRVELERDGKTLVEEKTLTIVGGEQYELSFDFADASAQVASLN
jgi:uncharacterized protein (TIGR03000 family)